MSDFPPELPSNEELQQSLKRLSELEEYVKTNVPKNTERIKNTRAVSALTVFFAAIIFFRGEVQLGDRFSANIKTRDIDTGDLITLAGFGLASIGVIGYEDLLGLIKKTKN